MDLTLSLITKLSLELEDILKKKKKSSKVSVQTVCLGFAQQQQRKQIRLHSEKCKPGLCLNKIALLHGTTYTIEVFGNLFRHYQSFS